MCNAIKLGRSKVWSTSESVPQLLLCHAKPPGDRHPRLALVEEPPVRMPGDIADCLLLDCAEAENSALLDYLARDVPWQMTTLCLNK